MKTKIRWYQIKLIIVVTPIIISKVKGVSII